MDTETIKKRLEEAEGFLGKVRTEIVQMQNAEQQVVGRITTLKEMLEDEPETVAGEIVDDSE